MTANAAALWLETTFYEFDVAITLFIHNLFYPGHTFFTPFFEFVSFLCYDGIPLIILSILLMIFKKTRRYGTAMLLGLAVGALITNCFLKIVIARPRPYLDVGTIFPEVWEKVGMNTESDKSFPSGHTTAAFAAMTALFLTGDKRKTWTAYIFAILVGISRIYLAVHHASDVLGGVIVGLIGGFAGVAIAAKIPSKFYGRPFQYPVFITTDKHKISDIQTMEDYESSEKIGRCTFGKLALYYQDLGKKYIVPYEYIDHAFIRVSECGEDEFAQSYSYYRVILEHLKVEFANLIYNKEEDARAVLNKIKSLSNLK